MLRDEFEAPGETSPEELRRAYERVLAEVVESVGVERVASESGVDEDTLAALQDGESPTLTLAEATAILAADSAYPDAEFLLADARDILLLGMSTAVLDVDAVESGLNAEMEAKEIQQKVEGRQPLTLAEYARLHKFIASRM
ncbi:MAG: DUF5791 family protein [Halorientalis sp.]